MEMVTTSHFYGNSASQCGELFLPVNGIRKGLICLIHGGYWQCPHDKNQMNYLAKSLVVMGYGVWNIEYRRLGENGGGWPGTFDDVVSAVNYLKQIPAINETDITIVGHSAGGHLALWLSHQHHNIDFTMKLVIALAPVTDLITGFELNMGDGVIQNLLGTTPVENKDRYLITSPIELLPKTVVPQVIIHGADDEYVDISMTNDYVRKAKSLTEKVSFVEVKGGYHLDFLDPESASAKALFSSLK